MHMVYPQIVKTPDFCFFGLFGPRRVPRCSEQASKTLVKKKKKKKIFFEIFEKSADFVTNFGWGISTTKGSLIVSRKFAPIRVFFREKTAKYKTRIGATRGEY